MGTSDNAIQLWQVQMIAGRECYESKLYLSALGHYRQAILLARAFFNEYPNTRTAVVRLITSYHKLAGLFLKEGELDLAESELSEVHQIVNSTLSTMNINNMNIDELMWGAARTYSTLTEFLKIKKSTTYCAPLSFPNNEGEQIKVYLS